MEQRLTGGKFIFEIGSNLDLSSFQKSTRVSLAHPKEGRGPQICTHLEDCGGLATLWVQAPVGSWTPQFLYMEAGPRAGGSEPPLTCQPSAMAFPLLQTQLAILTSFLAFSSPRRRQNQTQPLPASLSLPTDRLL